ncbi:MAG TPA: SUF system NifU family Fe-S cluster assembly protein [Candidatus Acetothermia bacterium]|nr:SUF system NifU family Fe-S cluster assembly protein [Candidatus Acetothermia bacterium]
MSGYEEIILDHWRRPRNKGRLPDATGSAVEANPLCGDIVRLEVKVQDGAIAAARFTGEGCAISLASASLLTELITGKPVAEVERMKDEDLLAALGGVVKTRLSCALLPLRALRRALASEGPPRRTLPPSEV